MSVVEYPTGDHFVYNRQHPPFFFVEPTLSEVKHWNMSMLNMTREYFRMSRQYGIKAQTPLSNGATAGEYCMWVLWKTHEKRVKKQ